MITLLLSIISFASWSFPLELSSVYEQLEVHEFYKENELINRPRDAWQTIASFSVVNSDLSLSKVCFKYRPADEAKGIFRVELHSMNQKCDHEGKFLHEINSLFGIQFQRSPDFKIIFSHKDFTQSSWTIPIPRKKKELSLLDTPDNYWGESVLFLTNEVEKKELIKDGTKCLNVADDCSVIGTSSCHQCANGSLEAPNGCLVGPRYCSSAECGTKGNPACRKGVKFQKKRTLDCRRDDSFAFCAGEGTPTCQGQEVWCL